MPFDGEFTQKKYAQQVIDRYQEADVLQEG